MRIRQLGRDVLTVQSTAERWLSYTSAVLLSAMMLLTSTDVILRYLLNKPIMGAYEATGFLLVGVICLAFAYVQGQRANIALEILVDRMQPRPRLVLGLLGFAIGLIFFGALAYQGWVSTWDSLIMKEFSSGTRELPMYPARFALSIGASLMCIRLLLDITCQLARLLGLTSVE